MEKTGVELIADERKEQIEKHGRTIKKDVKLNGQEQLRRATIYLLQTDRHSVHAPFGWSDSIWEKMMNKPYKERLIIAGALIAAEIDRLQAD